MAGKGPAPTKNESQRRHTSPNPGYRQLPFSGRHGDTPAWPLDTPNDAELMQWQKLWTLPQAVMWERLRCEDTVALYVRAFQKAAANDDTKMLSEARQLDSKLGLSPRSMLDLRWEIESAPAEEESPREALDRERVFIPRTEA
jgi:hypothetical protein